MNIVIFGENTKRSIEKALSILEEIPREQIKEVRKTSFSIVVEFVDEGTLRTATANESSRGIRFEEVYIDSLIKQDIVDFIIFPHCNTNCKIHFFL